MSRVQTILDFILGNFDKCTYHGGGSYRIALPEFELMPYDYIEYAKNELDKNTDESLINCVAHLKRAIDCELDKFLYAINISELISKNNLGFDVKLKCIEQTGMFSSKSLQLLNKMRNKMEHEYSVPPIEDLQVHYELCNAFILVVESYISILSSYGDPFEWYEETPPDKDGIRKFAGTGVFIVFEQEIPKITFEIRDDGNDDRKIEFQPTDKETIADYLKALNIFFILCRNDTSMSNKRALKLLRAIK